MKEYENLEKLWTRSIEEFGNLYNEEYNKNINDE